MCESINGGLNGSASKGRLNARSEHARDTIKSPAASAMAMAMAMATATASKGIVFRSVSVSFFGGGVTVIVGSRHGTTNNCDHGHIFSPMSVRSS